jgi:hypothetical protein
MEGKGLDAADMNHGDWQYLRRHAVNGGLQRTGQFKLAARQLDADFPYRRNADEAFIGRIDKGVA